METAYRTRFKQEVVREVLTPVMVDRLLALKARTGRTVRAAFTAGRACIAVHYGRDLFEAGIKDTTSREAIRGFVEEFGLAEAVVQELDLNTRIWTKGVDTSLLGSDQRRPPTPA